MTSETILQEAIGLAREGRKAEARWLLEDLLRADHANETAWLWYADCVETVDERVQALERCLRSNPDARRARAGLEMLRNPRPVRTSVFLDQPPAPEAKAAPAAQPVETTPAAAVFLSDSELGGQPSASADGASSPAFALTPEDEWLLSDGAAVFTVSPDALTPDELADMAARTEAFLAETRPEMRRPLVHRRVRRQEDWPNLEQPTGTRAVRRKTAQVADLGMSRAAYTTLTALAVVIVMVLMLGAAIILRGA